MQHYAQVDIDIGFSEGHCAMQSCLWFVQFYEYIVKGKKGIVKGLSVHFKFNLKEESPSKPNLCANARFGLQKSRVIGIQKFLENIRFWVF